jgi:hypothetical protein
LTLDVPAILADAGFGSIYANVASRDSASRIAVLLKRSSKNAPRAMSCRFSVRVFFS